MASSHLVNADTCHHRDFPCRARLRHGKRERNVAKEKRPAAYSAMQKMIGKRIQWARLLVEPNRAAFCRDCAWIARPFRKSRTATVRPGFSWWLSYPTACSIDGLHTQGVAHGGGRGVGGASDRSPSGAPDHNRTAMGGGTDPAPRRRAGKKWRLGWLIFAVSKRDNLCRWHFATGFPLTVTFGDGRLPSRRTIERESIDAAQHSSLFKTPRVHQVFH